MPQRQTRNSRYSKKSKCCCCYVIWPWPWQWLPSLSLSPPHTHALAPAHAASGCAASATHSQAPTHTLAGCFKPHALAVNVCVKERVCVYARVPTLPLSHSHTHTHATATSAGRSSSHPPPSRSSPLCNTEFGICECVLLLLLQLSLFQSLVGLRATFTVDSVSLFCQDFIFMKSARKKFLC
jgi:hypothetical protein